jgi:hypothetical protein
VTHRAYFDDIAHARDAADRVQGSMRSTRIAPAGDRKHWMVEVAAPPDESGEVRDQLEALARARGGTYDGWEIDMRRDRSDRVN